MSGTEIDIKALSLNKGGFLFLDLPLRVKEGGDSMPRVLMESYVRDCKPCLLLQYHVALGSEECFVDFPIVGGSDKKIQRYVSRISGECVEDVPEFLEGMKMEDAEKLLNVFKKRLSRTTRYVKERPGRRKEDMVITQLEHSVLNGCHSDASFYLCDIGHNGAVEKSYGNSKKFVFSPAKDEPVAKMVQEPLQYELFDLKGSYFPPPAQVRYPLMVYSPPHKE